MLCCVVQEPRWTPATKKAEQVQLYCSMQLQHTSDTFCLCAFLIIIIVIIIAGVHWGVFNNHGDCVRMLVKFGADPDKKGKFQKGESGEKEDRRAREKQTKRNPLLT